MQNASVPLLASIRKAGRRAALFGAAAVALAAPATAGAEAPFATAAAANVSFARASAHVVGPTALVVVHCAGSQRRVCSGTVSLAAGGHRHQVPFSVLGGSSESVAVPVGDGALDSGRGLAVARTAQPAGGFAVTTEVLRLR